MVLLEAGKLTHKNYINIWPFDELRNIVIDDDFVEIGALITYTEIQSAPVLRDEFPMLCQAASETGGLAIQNRGTIGGNIVNGSPAADSPPALLAYDAEVELLSISGSRWVAYDKFHKGYKLMDLQPGELLSRVRLPRNATKGIHYYRKVGTRRAQAISKVCFAARAFVKGGRIEDLRIALGSVAPIVVRCVRTEDFLRGRSANSVDISTARNELVREISPIDDIRSTAGYRQRVAANLLEDFLGQLALAES
jgi:CO/xanthine dehydrogenase FAD-binding subunit